MKELLVIATVVAYLVVGVAFFGYLVERRRMQWDDAMFPATLWLIFVLMLLTRQAAKVSIRLWRPRTSTIPKATAKEK